MRELIAALRALPRADRVDGDRDERRRRARQRDSRERETDTLGGIETPEAALPERREVERAPARRGLFARVVQMDTKPGDDEEERDAGGPKGCLC